MTAPTLTDLRAEWERCRHWPVMPANVRESTALGAATALIAALDARIAELLRAEHDLSDAYVRLRDILGAFDTPRRPSAAVVWAHTEARAKAQRDALRQAREALESIKRRATDKVPLPESEPRNRLQNIYAQAGNAIAAIDAAQRGEQP